MSHIYINNQWPRLPQTRTPYFSFSYLYTKCLLRKPSPEIQLLFQIPLFKGTYKRSQTSREVCLLAEGPRVVAPPAAVPSLVSTRKASTEHDPQGGSGHVPTHIEVKHCIYNPQGQCLLLAHQHQQFIISIYQWYSINPFFVVLSPLPHSRKSHLFGRVVTGCARGVRIGVHYIAFQYYF